MAEATLSIGEVAEKAGIAISAIRYYERNGLLPEAERVSGQRRFTEETVQRLGTIGVAKQAGFSLDEVRVLLTSIDEGAPAHEQIQALAARKLPEVEALVERAQRMRDWLNTASACDCESLEACALFIPLDTSDGSAADQLTSAPRSSRPHRDPRQSWPRRVES
jgi:MerR family transcriptional regulator, redox-sensitive transcriptional activator SoxR